MKISSVSGKNWLIKKYNGETVSYLKNNFNLSEIISKLLSIRNIKIEEVNLFLNPKIKNYLTLAGKGRHIELGAFLSPGERIELRDKIQNALAKANSA